MTLAGHTRSRGRILVGPAPAGPDIARGLGGGGVAGSPDPRAGQDAPLDETARTRMTARPLNR